LITISGYNEPKNINVLCKNSYERRIVHILARGLGLYHARYGDWDCVKFERFFDRQCKCSQCWSYAGENCFRIIGVKISNYPIVLSKKDKIHQK
jgi:Pyruvate/2-oxoacid:ferredoxin oxidoreductase delta subunit